MFLEDAINGKPSLPEGRWAVQNNIIILPNEQEKTYVISWKFNDGSGCTAVIKANTIDEAINSMEVDIDDICITYIYHD